MFGALETEGFDRTALTSVKRLSRPWWAQLAPELGEGTYLMFFLKVSRSRADQFLSRWWSAGVRN